MTKSAFPHNANQDAEDLSVVARYDNRLHVAVRGLQANMLIFGVKALESRLIVDHGDDPFAIVGSFLLLDDHIIAIVNVVFDHGITANLEGVIIRPTEQFT